MTGLSNPGAIPLQAAVLMNVERELCSAWIAGANPLSPSVEKINEHGRSALEFAMRLKAEQGWHVTALAWPPASNIEALRYALARGAERAVYLDGDGDDEPDSMAICSMLAQALANERYDLILCGSQSQAALGGLLAPLLAGRLDLPQVTRLVDGDVRDGMLVARRSLEGGLREEVVCPLPAVAAVLPGESISQYVAVHRRASVKMDSIERRPVSKPANTWILKVLTPPRKRAQAAPASAPGGSAAERMKQMLGGGKKEQAGAAVFSGPPEAAVEKIYAYLQEHGFLPTRDED